MFSQLSESSLDGKKWMQCWEKHGPGKLSPGLLIWLVDDLISKKFDLIIQRTRTRVRYSTDLTTPSNSTHMINSNQTNKFAIF